MTTRMRKIVRIDEDKCDGCGLCVPDCAEGAIQVIDGKARLVAENLCDGLGNCLGVCPNGAISIEERPADEFDECAVEVRKHAPGAVGVAVAAGPEPASEARAPLPCGCPGTMPRKLDGGAAAAGAAESARENAPRPSRLGQWPVQLDLLPPAGQIWQDADVLIAADCVGFAMPDFHERLLAGGEKTLAVACPKLDDIDAHTRKLTAIFANNEIRSVTVAHMEVPCCTGIVHAVRTALRQAGRDDIPVREITVGVGGEIPDES